MSCTDKGINALRVSMPAAYGVKITPAENTQTQLACRPGRGMGCANVGRSRRHSTFWHSVESSTCLCVYLARLSLCGLRATRSRRRIGAEIRRMNMIDFFDSLGRDLRYALRGLARRPAFAFAAVLTLALGIGATTAIFSVVYSVLIRPLPYPNADELVRIQYRAAGIPNSGLASSEPSMYFTFGDESQTLAGLGMWQGSDATLSGYGEPE